MSAAKDERGKWLPGQSGNPGGLSSTVRAAVRKVRELAVEHTEEAFMTLVSIMRDEEASRYERRAAAESILDRAVGKPMQAVRHTDDEGNVLLIEDGYTLNDVARRIAFALEEGLRVMQVLPSLDEASQPLQIEVNNNEQ